MNEQNTQITKNVDTVQEIFHGTEPINVKGSIPQTGFFAEFGFQKTSRIIPPPEEFVGYPTEVQMAFLENMKAQRVRADKEQEHRHISELKRIENEKISTTASFDIIKITAVLGFFVLLSTVIGSIFCAIFDHENVAITLASTAIVAICGAMIKLALIKDRDEGQEK